MDKNNNVLKTVKSDLCVSCGACEAVCPAQAVALKFFFGKFEPVIDLSKCVNCGLCLKLCPGMDFSSVPDYSPENVDNFIRSDSLVASVNSYSRDPLIRYAGTSGGVITSLIKNLIENKEYSKAYVLRFDNLDSIEAQLAPTSNIDEILASAGSKYIPVSIKNVVEMIKRNIPEKSIVVATSCQLIGIIKCIEHFKFERSNILFLGLFCHKTFNFNAVNYYERQYGKKNEKLKKISFRTKEKYGWPGGSKLVFDSGRELVVDKSTRKYCKIFFQLNRCLFCTDKFNNFADISFGDCYIPEHQDKNGKSNIIIRTELGKRIFDKYKRSFVTQPVNVEDIKQSQNYCEEKLERLRNVYILLSNKKVKNENWYKQTKKNLYKKKKLLNLGKKGCYNRIDRKMVFLKLKDNETVKWHLQTCKLALVWLAGVCCKLKACFIQHKNQKSKNIVIVGGEFFNKGSQAMVYVTVDSLKRKFPDKNFYLFSCLDFSRDDQEKNNFCFKILPWDFNTQLRIANPVNKIFVKNSKYYQYENVIRKILKETFLITDISGFGLSSQFGDSKSYKYMLNIIIACRYKIPFYILPQSIGPFDYSKSRNIFLKSIYKMFLPYPEKIFVREKDALRYITKFTSDNVILKNDIVLLNDKYELTNIYKSPPKLKQISIFDNSVGIVPNRNICAKLDANKMYNLYFKFIELALKKGKKVYVIKHSYEDILLCREIKNMFADNDNVFLLDDEFNAVELEQIISKLQVLVASRYHSIIHAYKNNVPALVIGWSIKYAELLELFNQIEYLFDCREEIDEIKLIEKWKKLITNSNHDTNTIRSVMDKLKIEKNVFDYLS